MLRKGLAIGIILLFVGVTIAPTINFNTVKASQQNLIQERINQRELLFQTIVDIANNKEIQRIILKAQMSRGVFPESELSVVTKNQIRKMYFLGLILSKVVINSRIQSMVQQYQFNNQNIQMEMYDVIEKDTTLNTEITQLKGFDCDCNNKDTTFYWRFPMICVLLLPSVLLNFFLYIIAIFIWGYLGFYPPVLFFEHKLDKFDSIGFRLSCFWWHFMFSEW
ncbi:MAG TPA: hypothetical protein HA258_04645 [Thermoplasmata archaeon]|nr:hypothetical protein [Thermoplasmata archaeon]